ncbi:MULTISPECIES: phage/plasmid primase, P4 family [Oceanobacillus]|uniref:SF3 helicase domain-containing protein n=1 Tax=Oceanobacillus indicireducens TaxID=1004261 RepID=A0A917XYU5_9BACI|nr:phage/plasmid primase, P4 family [Oceanobacillus indicireducens]GGN59405.1 hypothetical protein GCM10007971_22480 [Oceanobacillus indicireducens]
MLRFIELDGKVPKHDFKTFSTDHKNYDDAGVILNKDIIVVDFDDYTDIGGLIYSSHPTLKVHTTRGFHLWYKRPTAENIRTPFRNYTDKLTVSGAKVDYKTGTRAHATIKQNGKLRRMENEQYLDNINDLPELPFLLYPSKLRHDIYQMTDGQGRNSALYSHLLSTLEQYSLDGETLNELADFINKYVFAKPLDERELKNTIQSVKNKNPAPTKQKYLDPKDIIMTSEVLVERLDIHLYRGKLFFKQDDHFIYDNNLLLRAIDKLIALKPNQHKQLLDLFQIKSTLQDADDLPVQFANGYVLYDNEVVEVDPGFTPYYLNIDYKEDAYDEHVDNFLNWFTCNRKDLRNVIEEMFGHVLMTKGFPHKSFFFWGESGSNGKSTLIKMLQAFAEGLHTNVPLDKFEDDTSVYSLIGTLLNVADDIDASYLDKSSNFKTIASGDPVMVRPIYQTAIAFSNKATLVFTCNELPVFKDKSGGIKRRMQIIPCDAVVQERDVSIDEKLSSPNAKSYLLKLALAGVERILKNGDLSKSETIEDVTRQYFVESDSVVAFLEEHDMNEKVTSAAYRMYAAYCEEHGLNAVGNTEFGRRLKSAGYGKKRITKDGKRPEVYVK